MIKKYLALGPPYLLVLSLPFYFIRFSLFGLPTNLLEMVFVSLYGLYQFLTGSNVIAPLEAAQSRITSFFNHPNFLALFLGPIILLLLSEFKTSQKQFKKWLLGTLLTMFCLAFILAGSV